MEQKTYKDCAGFSLISMTMLILVVGFFTAGALKMYSIYNEQQSAEVTKKNLAAVQEALDTYAKVNGHLPCPASMIAAVDTPEFGQPVPTCTAGNFPATTYDPAGVSIGAVPVRALDLPDTMMLDGGKSRLVYAVTASFAEPGADMTSPDGKITIKDASGNQVTAVGSFAIYAIISPGADKRGAYNLAGVQIEPCDVSAMSGENCNGDAVFISSLNPNFSETSDMFTARFAYMANTATYNWITDAWGTCNAPCQGTGTESRNVFCRRGQTTVADSYCLAIGAKPDTSQSCSNTTQCPVTPDPLAGCHRFYRQTGGPQGGSLQYVLGFPVPPPGTCPKGYSCINAFAIVTTPAGGQNENTTYVPVYVAQMPMQGYNMSGSPCTETPNGSNGGAGG